MSRKKAKQTAAQAKIKEIARLVDEISRDVNNAYDGSWVVAETLRKQDVDIDRSCATVLHKTVWEPMERAMKHVEALRAAIDPTNTIWEAP